jgi:hypothetical protein
LGKNLCRAALRCPKYLDWLIRVAQGLDSRRRSF